MRKRDKSICDNLARFRCLTRDDIIDLHFKNLKYPISAANTVLNRLRLQGHITANINQQPYVYFVNPSPIKKDSQKIPHFLAIVDFYKQIIKFKKPEIFQIEPKFDKGMCEPDICMVLNSIPFFVEIQKNHYSSKVMNAKMQRYEKYYASGLWKNEHWQVKGNEKFPHVWFVTDTRYSIQSKHFTIFQTKNVHELKDFAFSTAQTPKRKIVNNSSTNIKFKGL